MHQNGSVDREALTQQGWELLESGEFVEAEEVADQLITLEVAGGYRLKAMCQVAYDEWEDAMASLDAGIIAFPEDWELHLMQGNFFSETEAYDQALAAFERALDCPDVQPSWINLNKAVIHSKMGEYEAALNICQSLEDPELKLQVLEVELRVLGEMDQADLIVNIAEDRLAELPEVEDGGTGAMLSKVLFMIAKANWEQEQPEESTLEYLWASIDYDRTNPHALWLLREIKAEYSTQAKLYKLLVKGDFVPDEEETEEATAFFTSYDVVADSVEEAFEMVREFEVEDVAQDSLEILQFEETEPEPESAKGIYEVGVFGFMG